MKTVAPRTLALLILALLPMPLLAQHTCANALIRYTQQYPAAQPQDLYKLAFQDLYGPGHIITDSLSCAGYIQREANTMRDTTLFPLWEYTLCDSAFVRVNLLLVKRGTITVSQLTSLVLQSAADMPTPEPRFHMGHSQQFKDAYDPHYRIIRRDLFEQHLLPLLQN